MTPTASYLLFLTHASLEKYHIRDHGDGGFQNGGDRERQVNLKTLGKVTFRAGETRWGCTWCRDTTTNKDLETSGTYALEK